MHVLISCEIKCFGVVVVTTRNDYRNSQSALIPAKFMHNTLNSDVHEQC